jgi:hypothetical protein
LKLEVIDSANLMRTLLRSVVCLLLASASAQAQAVSTAQINGTVKDSGGLPLPGVTVTMTQTAGQFEPDVERDAAGWAAGGDNHG